MPSVHQVTPTLIGEHTAAWPCSQCDPADPRSRVSVGGWIVYAAWAHPIWPYHLVGVVALRDAPGLDPAYIRVPGATHEIFVIALNPDKEPDTDGPLHQLTPINFSAQFKAENDEAAAKILRHTVEEVVSGQLNPDTDGVVGWVQRFGTDGFKPEYRPEYDAILKGDTKGAH